jgi:hypothetical protein
MYRLLEKPEISGTCWIEFNVSGSNDTYEHWQASSRYASLDAMDAVYKVFALCIENFNLYCPILIDHQMAREVSMMLDGFASTGSKEAARKFASELSLFMRESIAEEKFIWMLGV